MTTPCEQKEYIAEIRTDVKDLLAFKNRLLGIQAAVSIISTGVIAFCAWIISLVIK